MPVPLRKIKDLAKSPQGRRLVDQARATANDPRNREKLQTAWRRIKAGNTGQPKT